MLAACGCRVIRGHTELKRGTRRSSAMHVFLFTCVRMRTPAVALAVYFVGVRSRLPLRLLVLRKHGTQGYSFAGMRAE